MEAEAMQRKAMDEVGDTGRNARYELSLPLSTNGGTFPLSFAGQSTLDLPRWVAKEALQSTLELLPNIGAGNIKVLGLAGGPWRFEFAGDLGAQPLPAELYPFTADGANLTPPAALNMVPIGEGRERVLTAKAAELFEDYASVSNERLRFLLIKRGLIDLLLGGSYSLVDVESGDRADKLSQQFANLRALRALVETEMAQLGGNPTGSTASTTSTPHAGKIRKMTPNGLPYGVLGVGRSGRLS